MVISPIPGKYEGSDLLTEDIDKDRILHLMEHWIEHNESHLKNFNEWSKKIGEAGYEDVAANILEAAGKMEECNQKLQQAKDSI
ncbi:hypothetical protein Metho_0695 [Methanomethylovorans hollandica DSM 15978]|uniref:DUF8180 domain-containing protein n=1 Tax=Methanomethylovorans hollandica (strain DSM 15978 / NBRC 107637 / DMS1) TaxID=867904 RepID=L0KXZ0_METHD|nr:hypothetical protein Metho_0695 [Methanomethylovorans hollandica DSM 15978]